VNIKRHLLLGFLLFSLLWTALAEAAEKRQGRWELLGRQDVTFKRDHDRIPVGKKEGPFRQLQVKVQGAPVEIGKMTVTFGNGETFSPDLKHRFKEGATTRVIDLPGERRAIKSIEFNYRRFDRGEGKATVAVYAR
jgi:hypothetical protein